MYQRVSDVLSSNKGTSALDENYISSALKLSDR